MNNNKIDLIYERKLDPFIIRKIVKALNEEKMPLYMEVRDEEDNLIGFKKLLTKKRKQFLINSAMKRIRFMDSKTNMTNFIYLYFAIDSIENEIDSLEETNTYIMAMDGDEKYESAIEDMEMDIANLSRIDSYKKRRSLKKSLNNFFN